MRENFGVEPDEWQRDMLLSAGGQYQPRRRIGMKACTGPGKTAGLAWLGWHRLSCFGTPGNHPKGAALSITADNLKDNLWPELSKWQQRSPYLKGAFTWTKTSIYANDHPETWFLSSRSFAKDADSDAIGRALSGLHSDFPFVLLDEIGDMPIQVLLAAEQIFSTTIDALIAAAGNPTSTTGLLYHIFTAARSQWALTTITADPDDVKRTPRVSIENAREQIAKWGRDNPWVMATILGLFPSSGFNVLLGVTEVELAFKRPVKEADYEWVQKRIGCDVARFGDDSTVLAPRQGLRAFNMIVMRGQNNMQVAARLKVGKTKFGSELEFVDGTGGNGVGVIDAMNTMGTGCVEVQFSGKAQDPMFFNARTEMWWRMAEWVKKGGMLPNDPDLVRELTSPTYSYQGGKIRLEEKDQIKKRLGFSPDKGDALACTFYIPDVPGKKLTGIEAIDRLQDNGGVDSDWDPFKDREADVA